jgi:hypothetical protein
MGPKRIQRRREKGWRMPEGAVYVGRPTKWGNPFRVRRNTELGEVDDQQTAVWNYWHWMRHPRHWALPEPPDVAELRGKDLACWCPLSASCHADVLLELANERLGVS